MVGQFGDPKRCRTLITVKRQLCLLTSYFVKQKPCRQIAKPTNYTGLFIRPCLWLSGQAVLGVWKLSHTFDGGPEDLGSNPV